MRTLAIAQHKKAQAVELMLNGTSYDDIARQVGYSHRGSAHRAVRQALHDREVAAIDQLRTQEVARLDALQALMWPLAEAGDVHAAASVLRIVEQRVRILGLEHHSPASDTTGMALVSARATQEEQRLRQAS
jgi:transposase-like protein